MSRFRLIGAAAFLILTALPGAPRAAAQPVTPSAPGGPGDDMGTAEAPISPLSRPEAHDHDQDQPDDKKDKKEAPPPTLPGSHAEAIPAAPPDQNLADLNPTELLFDAINRGDTDAARDALSRGADLNGRNVLGQTPLAMSVDLGRNDISFLLLSMRGSMQQSSAEQEASAAPTPTDRAAAPDAVPQGGSASVADAPAPASGFLGFGGS